MKKVSFAIATVVAMAMGANVAAAADLPAKVYTKAPPAPAFDPWDIAFGAAIASDYIFRGVTQSNHQPSATAYFEPRYNFTKDLQVYVGSSWESISFTNRAAAEVDIYGGIRPTFGAWAFDFGVWGYLYPGGVDPINYLPVDGIAYIKKDVSFYEAYGKVNYTFNDYFTLGATAFYSPNFLNAGTDATYASVVGKLTAPATWLPNGIGSYVSGEFGRQWLGTTDSFYGNAVLKDYNTWNVGVGFTWKVFTLDLRYSDTDMSKSDCWLFTGDFNSNTTLVPTSNWCGSRFTAKLSADVTLQSNIK